MAKKVPRGIKRVEKVDFLEMAPTYYDHFPGSLAVSDALGNILYANQAFHAQFGVVPQITRLPFAQPAGKLHLEHHIDQFFHHGQQPFNYLARLGAGSQEVLWKISGFPFQEYPGTGQTPLLVCIFEKSHATEEAMVKLEMPLKENIPSLKQHLSDTEKIAQLGSWKFDIQTKTWWASTGVYHLLNLPPTETQANLLNRLSSPGKWLFFKKLLQCIRHQSSFDIEISLQEEANRVLRITGIPHLGNGQEGMITGFVQDISFHKELTTTMKRLAAVAEHIQSSVIITDKYERIVYVNKGFTKLTGYTLEEAKGKKPGSLLQGPESDRITRQKIRQAILTKRPFEGEIYNYSKAGHGYWGYLQIAPIVDPCGKVQEFISVLTDITDIKSMAERLLKQNHELLLHQEEMDRFVYSASHDMRAPLASILGLAEVAALKGVTLADCLYYFKLVGLEIKKLDKYISDVTDFAQNKKLAVTYEPVDFVALCQEVLQELNHITRAAEITVSFIGGQPDTYVLTDTKRLKIILKNLLSNSIKYADFSKSKPTVLVQFQIAPGFLSFAVQDNGIGIDPISLPKVFELFYQATSRAYGSGIGLYIVKQAIEKLHGHIYLTSEVGKGTTASVYLPARQSH
jgi:PAS domain S-box-containing protein